MQGYIIRRIIGAIFVVFLTGTFSFFAIRILPGDAASAALGLDAGSASPEQIEERRAEYGLDKPLFTQYGNWLWDTVRLDLGNSFTNRGNSVWYEIGRSLPYSVELGILNHDYRFLRGVPGWAVVGDLPGPLDRLHAQNRSQSSRWPRLSFGRRRSPRCSCWSGTCS